MKFIGTNQEYIEVLDLNQDSKNKILESVEGALSVLWFEENDNILEIDSVEYSFQKNQLISLTSFHKIKITRLNKTKFLRFNVPFYCIVNHDSEVGCKGVLFFGSNTTPIINIHTEEDLNSLDLAWKSLVSEMSSRDTLQLEMLQMLLKRILITLTRKYKKQENYSTIPAVQSDIIREFNYLVESHFKEKHSVSEYAELLNKSPKTLSNLFGKLHDKSPLQVIQNRILLEVKRLLSHTDKGISEIAYEVGYNDIQSFSRFFKKQEGVSPTEYRSSKVAQP